MNPKEYIRTLSYSLGFDLMGVADIPKDPSHLRHFYQEWIDKGYMGSLTYIENNLSRRTDPREVVPNAQSVIMFATNYFRKDPPKPDPQKRYGRIAKYARGKDYHKIHEARAKVLIPALQETFPDHEFRFYVDYGPLAERYYAQRAGLGFVGKNCNLITKEFGSWVYLSGIITTLPLAPDTPARNECGTCTKCLDSCPTQAFVAPFQLDSTKCLSYLTTIKHKSQLPKEVAKKAAPWVFGCDVCQNCCPFNVRTPEASNPDLTPIPELDTHLDMERALAMSAEEFFQAYPTSVLRRWREEPQS